MKYKIGINIIYEDRTETRLVEGEDVNDVHNKVVDIQISNLPSYYWNDVRKRKELKKEIAKTTS